MPAAATQDTRNRLLEFFAFERGETRPALLLTLYLLLAIASVIALKAASKALYLAPNRFHPRSLPYVYVVTAVAVSFVVSIYLKLAARLRQDRLLIYTQLFFASNLVLFWWLLRLRPLMASGMLIVWTGIYAVILVSQVWTLANHIFTTRQARRLFSIISSGGILGCALGGQFSSLMTRRVGAENLLLVYVPFLLACAAIVAYLWRTTRHLEAASSTKGKLVGPASLADSVRAIRASRYLSLIALLVFVSAVVGVLVDFQFTYIVKHAIPDPNNMTAFLSDFYSYMAVLSFLMHVILSSRVMRTFGLNFAIFVLPAAMLLGSAVLVLSAGLLAGALIKGFDQGFRHSIDRSATELLYVPLPARLRQQAKSFIDMVAARWADGVGGLLLIPLAGHDLLNLTMQQLAWVNLALVAPWLGVAWRLRREYVNTLRSSIERRDISAETLLMEMATSSPTESIAATLASSDDRAVETGLGLLQYGEASMASAQLGSLLMHMSPAIRRKALAIVAAKGVPDCAPQVSVFLFLESDVESLWKALDYVEQYDPEENYVKLKDLLDAPHAILRGTAAARLLGQAGSPDHAKAHEVFHAFIASALQDQPAYRQPAAEVLGRAPGDLDCQAALAELLRDADPAVVRAAASSAGRARQQSLVEPLLGLLADRRFRSEARRALAAFGPGVLPQLQRALLDPQCPPRTRAELPRVFAAVGGQEAGASLAACLNTADPELKRQILRALSRIRLRDPRVRLDAGRINPLTEKELRNYYKYLGMAQVVPANGASPATAFLRRALAEQLDRKLEVIFRLLGLLYPPKDIFDAYYGIRSGRRDLRANALEFLDSLLLNPVRQMLLPVIEGRSPERTVEYGRALFGIAPPTCRQALQELLAEPDPWLQSCAACAAAEQGLAEVEPLLEALTGADDALLAETARAARQRFRAGAAKT